jgi:ABC-type glycerol-3-phosphate transport system substrate-binding protein
MKTLNRLLVAFTIVVLLSLTISAVAAQERVTIDVWTHSDIDAIMPAAIEAFQAMYPHITVRLTDVPEDDYTTTLETAFLVNQPPDVALPFNREWVAAGNFLPLDDSIAAEGINLDDMNIPAMVAGNCYIDGHVYCLGSYTGAVLMFYNKDLLDAAGIPYPSATEPMSIDEYAEMARALTVHADSFEERVWGSDSGMCIWQTAIVNCRGMDTPTSSRLSKFCKRRASQDGWRSNAESRATPMSYCRSRSSICASAGNKPSKPKLSAYTP